MLNSKHITKFEAELMLRKMIKAHGENQWLKCENCYIKIDSIVAVGTKTITEKEVSYQLMIWTKNSPISIVYKKFASMKAAQKAISELVSMAKIKQLLQAA